MSDISDEVDVQITAADAKTQRAGFGLPLLLSFAAAWTERTREYTKATDVLTDFPTVGTKLSPEYRMASAVFAQNPRVRKVVIGRCALKPTQQFLISPNAVSSYAYRFKLDGQQVTFTSDSSATLAEVTAGIKAAIDALGLAVTVTTPTNTQVLIVANVAGAWFDYETQDRANMSVVQNHADPGVATDLAAIANERNDWYFPLCAFNSNAMVQAIASYAATNRQPFMFATIDTPVPRTAISGTDDIAEYEKNAANDYAWTLYKDSIGHFADCAWVGARAPVVPGTETWKFAPLVNVPADAFNATERTNMRAKNCNFYENTGGSNMTEEGYAASGRFMDLVRYIDALRFNLAARCFADMIRAGQVGGKIPFDDTGIGVFQSEVLGQLRNDAGLKILDKNSIQVNVPKASDGLPNVDKPNRVLGGITFSAIYTGAIHKAEITGQLNV